MGGRTLPHFSHAKAMNGIVTRKYWRWSNTYKAQALTHTRSILELGRMCTHFFKHSHCALDPQGGWCTLVRLSTLVGDSAHAVYERTLLLKQCRERRRRSLLDKWEDGLALFSTQSSSIHLHVFREDNKNTAAWTNFHHICFPIFSSPRTKQIGVWRFVR